MASGKETPRQKMINLMYLVFIAMMALNLSTSVLNAFGRINEDLNQSISATDEQNGAFMSSLAEKVTEQPAQYKPLMEKAEQINTLAKDLSNYIDGLKKNALATVKDKEDYASMSRSDYFDELLYAGGKITPTGREFKEKIEGFRDKVIDVIGDKYPDIAKNVKKEFNTDEVVIGKKGIKVKKKWIEANFGGFPMIASLTQLSGIQSDVKTVQSEVLSRMMQGQLISAVSMSNYEAIVIPSKSAFYSGENFTGTVVLGRVDKTMSFSKVTVNGNDIGKDEITAGQVALDMAAGNVGTHTIKGQLEFVEGDSIVKIPFEKDYTVIPRPNAAVISADKMNIVYRGVKNPMTISVPGASTIHASAPGLRKVGGVGQYVMDVTRVQAYDVRIKVSASLPGGQSFSDSKVFRIAEIPRPSGTVRGQIMQGGSISMQRNGLSISSVGAKIPNFPFDMKLRVTDFSIRVEGERTIRVHGNRLNTAAKRVLASARRGATVQIFDINARIMGNTSYKLPPVSPILIQLKD